MYDASGVRLQAGRQAEVRWEEAGSSCDGIATWAVVTAICLPGPVHAPNLRRISALMIGLLSLSLNTVYGKHSSFVYLSLAFLQVLNQIVYELPPEHPLSDSQPLKNHNGHTPPQVPCLLNRILKVRLSSGYSQCLHAEKLHAYLLSPTAREATCLLVFTDQVLKLLSCSSCIHPSVVAGGCRGSAWLSHGHHHVPVLPSCSNCPRRALMLGRRGTVATGALMCRCLLRPTLFG